jgi:aryl-alcohol dehydrogenase-like predicted oxidoreductase
MSIKPEISHVFQPRRQLGKTGFIATHLGIGDVADRAVPLDQCVATVRRALDAGLNLIDTAPSYENGYSEEIVGEALKGRRAGLFVMDKVDHFDKPVAPQVEESLKRLQMDSTDAFIFHGVSKVEDWARLAAPDGGMDELGNCVRDGKTRFRGISSHHPDVLKEAVESGLCDLVLFPVGPFVDRRYIEEIVPLAKWKGVGSIGMKTFGAGKLLGDTEGYGRPLQARPRGKFSSGGKDNDTKSALPRLTVRECVHYTLTLDPDVALLGMSFANEQNAAFEATLDFKPLNARQLDDIRRRAAKAVEHKGACWWNPDQG